MLLAEAECGAAGVPAAAQPAPVHHNPVAADAETRDKQATAVLHDRAPQEHRLTHEQFAEDSNALGLNGEPVLQVQAGGESVALLQVLVDGVADDGATLLVIVEPLLNLRLQVVFGGTRALQLAVLQLLEPVGVVRFDGAVHLDNEVQGEFGNGLGLRLLDERELVGEEPLGSPDTPEFVEHGLNADVFYIHIELRHGKPLSDC